MKNNAKLFNIIYILIFILLASFMFWEFRNKPNDVKTYTMGTYQTFDDGWNYYIDDTNKGSLNNLPTTLKVKAYDKVVLKNMVPKDFKQGDALVFFSAHSNVQVHCGVHNIYSFNKPQGAAFKSPGNAFNFAYLPPECAGKELLVEFEYVYGTGNVSIPSFYFGDKSVIRNMLFNDNLKAGLLSFLVFLLGVVSVFIWLILKKPFQLDDNILYAGLLAIVTSLWAGVESQVLNLIFFHPYVVTYVGYMCLLLMSYPFIQFFEATYVLSDKQKKVMQVVRIILVSELFMIIASSILGYKEFAQFLPLIHFTFFGILITSTSLLWGVIKSKQKKGVYTAKMHFLALSVLCITIGLDTFGVYSKVLIDDAKFSRFGMLWYIIILLYLCVHKAFRVFKEGKESHKIKEMAYTDALTTVGNRLAFIDYINAIAIKDYSNYGCVMIDLNSLKKVNDTYGHSVGDYYIVTCVKALQEVFAQYGEVFRIGGDEFVIVLYKVEVSLFERLIQKTLDELLCDKDSQINFEKAISFGYCLFDLSLDEDLINTYNRADVEMYKHKKQERKPFNVKESEIE